MAIRWVLIGVAAACGVASAQPARQATPPTGAEEAPFRSAFTQADTNGDGKLSKEEAAQVPTVGAKFEQLDRDRDGSLSLEEFGAGYTAGA